MPLDYLLEIACAPDDEDEILARLFLTKSSGSTSDEGLITAFFDTAADRDAAAATLADLDVTAVDRDRIDWLERYQQSLKPIFIGERFIVAPDARLFPETDRIEIVVPQEQAFGTGSHETTSLCIEILESMDVRGARGLDIGSGSGILAMAMVKLGARKVIAFDNDPDAYGALRDNRTRNRIDESAMPLFIGSVESLRAGAFDVITMNILPEVIIALLPEVMPHVRESLILSGILTSRRDDVVSAASTHGLTLSRDRIKGEWWAGELRPSSAAQRKRS